MAISSKAHNWPEMKPLHALFYGSLYMNATVLDDIKKHIILPTNKWCQAWLDELTNVMEDRTK